MFVIFLWEESAVHDKDVWELGSLLKRNGPARLERDRPHKEQVYAHAELASVIESIVVISTNVERAIAQQEERFKSGRIRGHSSITWRNRSVTGGYGDIPPGGYGDIPRSLGETGQLEEMT